MTVPVCANCSAPLPGTQGEQKCAFCGALNVIEHAGVRVSRAPTARVVVGSGVSPELIAAKLRRLYWWIGLMILLPTGATAAAFLLRSTRASSAALPVALHPADLHGLGDNFTELRPIDPAAIKPLEAFDPLARLPWATTLARSWAPDARLVNLELRLVPESGIVDLSSSKSDSRVKYQFASKGRDLAGKEMVKVSEKLNWSAIDIVVEKGGLRAVVSGNATDDRDPSPVAFGCTVPKIVELWRAKGLPFRQGYNLSLSDSLGHGRDRPYWTSADWGVPTIDIDCRPTR
jgi:hypothetical protein